MAKLGVALLSAILCLLALEVVARVHESIMLGTYEGWDLAAAGLIQVEPSPDPRINAVLRPNVDYVWSGIPVHINSRGLRGPVHAYAKPAGVFRVVCLGDSVAFGWRVRDNQSYCNQLQSMLDRQAGAGKYEVINGGVIGWDQPAELAWLEDEGVKYHPDLVIAEVTVDNDIYHSVYHIPPPSLKSWLGDHTVFWNYLSYMRAKLRASVGSELSQTRPAPGAGVIHPPFPVNTSDPAWDQWIQGPLGEMNQVARANGARLAVVVAPSIGQVEIASYPTTAQQVVAATGQADGFAVVDPLSEWRAKFAAFQAAGQARIQNGLDPLFADLVSHPSALGHTMLAERLYQSLQQSNLLAPRTGG